MANYEFNISNEKPSDEEINDRKNFTRLKHRYQTAMKPLHRSRLDKFKHKRLFIAVLLILLIIWLVMMSENDNIEDPKTNIKSDTEQLAPDNHVPPAE